MFFVDTTSGPSQSATLGSSSLGLKGEIPFWNLEFFHFSKSMALFPIIPGKLLSSRSTDTKKSKSKSNGSNGIKDFCGLMGWSNPELLHDPGNKEPIEAPKDILELNVAKEVGQGFNTHNLELMQSLKPVSIRQKKKQNKVGVQFLSFTPDNNSKWWDIRPWSPQFPQLDSNQDNPPVLILSHATESENGS